MSRSIRRRELLWAAIAAGLAAWLIYRDWRAKREQAQASIVQQPVRLVQPIAPGQFNRDTYG